jgi:hypothetical protein
LLAAIRQWFRELHECRNTGIETFTKPCLVAHCTVMAGIASGRNVKINVFWMVLTRGDSITGNFREKQSVDDIVS